MILSLVASKNFSHLSSLIIKKKLELINAILCMYISTHIYVCLCGVIKCYLDTRSQLTCKLLLHIKLPLLNMLQHSYSNPKHVTAFIYQTLNPTLFACMPNSLNSSKFWMGAFFFNFIFLLNINPWSIFASYLYLLLPSKSNLTLPNFW